MAFLAVAASEQLVGLVVADNLLGAGVDVQRSSNAHGQVAQMYQGGRVVADLDLGPGRRPVWMASRKSAAWPSNCGGSFG